MAAGLVSGAEELRLPGEDGTHVAASCAPFPDALSAFVWRNWPVVSVARMAKAVGAEPSALEAIAREMSLPVPQPPVSPLWRRKGYITVVKRNWHLLPYDQLLTMTDMTRKELAYSLVEDDFLFSKLGNTKPLCAPVVCTEETAAKGRAQRRWIAKTLKEEGVVPMAPEEPRFRFIEELSAMPSHDAHPPAAQSSFDLRLIFSYFADYGDPLGDDAVGSYPDGLLARLADSGVNAVWLHTVLSTLAKDPLYPEFGDGSERRIANLRTLVARAARHGIKVYLYVNEPRAQDDAFFEKPGRLEMRGARRQSGGSGYARCTSHPETRRWLRDSLRQVFSQVPGLGGVFTITMSENLTNCASRWKRETCPRCKDRRVGDIVAEVNRTIWEGVKAGDPNAEVIAWDWAWPKDERTSIVAQLPAGSCRIMSVSEIGMPFVRGGVTSEINEYSLSTPGPSDRAKAIWAAASAHGMKTAAKVQAALTWEMSAVPYLPVMDIVSEHAHNLIDNGVDGVMLSWSLGSAPTPNLAVYTDCRRGEEPGAVLDRLAERLYGRTGVAAARAAWTAYSDGFREYPFNISSVYCGNHTLGPANHLYAEPSGWTASMVGYPFDDLKRWRAIFPEDVWLTQMAKVRDGFKKGNAAFEGLVASLTGERRTAAERELGLFRAIENHFCAVVDQGMFVMAREKGNKAEMIACARRELETARKHLDLVRADSRIGYECSNHYFYIPQDIIEKMLNCRDAIARLTGNTGTDTPIAATWSTDDFDLSLATNGCLVSLKEKETGRELLRWKGKFASVVAQDGRETKVSSVSRDDDGRLHLSFDGMDGEAVMSVRATHWGLVFTAERLTVPDAKEFKFLIVYPVCRTYNGSMMNAMSDDESAVVLRTYELAADMRNRGNTVLEAVAEVAAHPPALPSRAALVAAPRRQVLLRMKELTRDAGILSSPCGGAWSLEAPENRESYIIGSVSRESAEDWIALAERGGFRTVSFYDWWKTLGHYDAEPKKFPRGDDDICETIAMLHAAGLKAGMHTLTAGIDFQDAWTRPVCHADLLVTHAYTLARPFSDGDTEMVVNEAPGPRHHLVTSFLSNGNILRVGGELFTYAGIRGDAAPYAFTGVKRGAYGTTRGSNIPAGTRVEYLFQHFYSFFPEPSSPFMDTMAAHLAARYRQLGFDFVYHDGAEPMSRYNVDLTRRKFAAAIDQSERPLQVEASVGGAHSWWFHSRLGAWDHPRWALKSFHDRHLAYCRDQVVKAEMLAPQVGWWSVMKADGSVRGSFTDESEYFASRNAGEDFAMSLTGVNVSKGPLAFSVERQTTIIGRYERFRLARAFTAEAMERMRQPGAEFRLAQGADGIWTLTPAAVATHRATADFRLWSFDAPQAGKSALRVEALYKAGDEGETLIGPLDAANLKTSAAEKVSVAVTTAHDTEMGDVLVLRAENHGDARRGAWGGAGLAYGHPYRNVTGGRQDMGKAFGFWVKGDGSGAVLDFRITSPRIHNAGQSDHFVTLDFTGWRRVNVLLRERDAARHASLAWPGQRTGHSILYMTYRDLVTPERIEKIEFFLNEIPINSVAEAVIAPVRAMSTAKGRVDAATVVVNGIRHAVPFALESGEYAELEKDVWTRYSEAGEPMEESAGAEPVALAAGANECRFEAADAGARTEVTLVALGRPFSALKPLDSLPAADRKTLDYEALDPIVYCPAKGLARPFGIAARPGETARLEVEILGPVKTPALEFRVRGAETKVCSFITDLEANEKLICRNGKEWKVVKDFKTVRVGTLEKPIPEVSGFVGVRVRSANPSSAHARVNLVKRYDRGN
ncbi:MAG: hypothetical protein IJH50_01490 [Kiritimatiellae bacterium]|nr:hypothetical protein [Kiritimatiellia bacterium]